MLERVQTDEPIRRAIGKSEPVMTINREVEIRTVCKNCNNGWMSELESESMPLLGSMLEDVALGLDTSHQTLAAAWATKTAVVLDSIKRRDRFYTESECNNLRTARDIPLGTKIWVGRYFGRSLHAGGGTVRYDAPGTAGVAQGSVVTLLVGHLIFQVFTMRIRAGYGASITIPSNSGKWEQLLNPIWPANPGNVTWPPPLYFSNYGQFPFASLVFRWKAHAPSKAF